LNSGTHLWSVPYDANISVFEVETAGLKF
jgi:hypothetical protein